MNKEDLINRIKLYFKNEDVKTSDEVISAYNLLEILKMEFEDARIAINGEYYQELINQNRNSKISTLIFSLQNKSNEKKDNYLNYKCVGIIARTNGKRSEATICFENNKFLKLYRNFDSYDIYYDEDIDYRFIHTNFDILNAYFNALEEFTKKTNMHINNFQYIEGIGNTDFIIQNFSNGFLVVTLRYDNKAHVEFVISIDSASNPDNIFEKSHYGKGSIASKVKSKKDELLRKIPININELDDSIQTILKNHLKNEKSKKLK